MNALRLFIRLLLAVIGLVFGFMFGFYVVLPPLEALALIGDWMNVEPIRSVSVLVFCSAFGGLFMFTVSPWAWQKMWQSTSWAESRLQKTPVQDIIAGSIGLIVGLIIANLLGSALSSIPFVGNVLPTVSMVIFGYIGVTVAVRKREDFANWLTVLPRPIRERGEEHAGYGTEKILDTSVIIDGRIADICASGFVEGTLIVPGFILEELRHVADSGDSLRRNRGRRGLDILKSLQKGSLVRIKILDVDEDQGLEVDSRLLKLAQNRDAKIITNDYNLNKIAQLQGVDVLNINELANAVKPVVLPGEDMAVQVIKDGKEPGQGVGYLDDGTMIVVDGGHRHIGDTIKVNVTSVLQTSAGRMIFAEPKAGGNQRRVGN